MRSSGALALAILSLLIMVGGMLQTVGATPGPVAGEGAASSQWLEEAVGKSTSRRPAGCWRRPWVCQEGQFPASSGRKMCCNDRCIDVSKDASNCGACFVRCPFSWTCCNGVCVDPRRNPFHCGGCNKRCAYGSACSYGMCGYAQQPPSSFPFPQPYMHH